ncbi:MAG TPA: hypothetical protein VG895_04025 [Patescibacteria group bacterium]|nr:hypothetical protein [Patescibacteria group bacterium]
MENISRRGVGFRLDSRKIGEEVTIVPRSVDQLTMNYVVLVVDRKDSKKQPGNPMIKVRFANQGGSGFYLGGGTAAVPVKTSFIGLSEEDF